MTANQLFTNRIKSLIKVRDTSNVDVPENYADIHSEQKKALIAELEKCPYKENKNKGNVRKRDIVFPEGFNAM